jgi:N-acetylmuramoyl-L-alanine amidase
MTWRLGLLAVVVCAVVAFVVSKALGGDDGTNRITDIVRVVRPKQPEARQEPTTTARDGEARTKSMSPATRTPRPSLPLEGKTISVDPGHNGGNFTHPEEIGRPVPAGANGTTKPCNTTGTETDDGSLTEAQFNWDVAQDLVPRLDHLGARVVLTRHSNDGVGPCVDERAEIANHVHASVALSIHADGNLAEGAHGFDVIHPSAAESVAPEMVGHSLKLAEAERNALVEAGVPPANYIGSEGLDERSDLAGLNLAKVPTVLVELGNMREPEEAAKLEDPAYRRELADALAAGIVAFLSPGSRWAFAGAGHAISMNFRLAEEPKAAKLSGYGTDFFSLQPGVATLVLLGFSAAALLGAALLLARRSRDV